jgi:hypothetical protein
MSGIEESISPILTSTSSSASCGFNGIDEGIGFGQIRHSGEFISILIKRHVPISRPLRERQRLDPRQEIALRSSSASSICPLFILRKISLCVASKAIRSGLPHGEFAFLFYPIFPISTNSFISNYLQCISRL